MSNEFISVRKKNTEEYGVVLPTVCGNLKVFYGAENGSDDKIITYEEFNREFEICKP